MTEPLVKSRYNVRDIAPRAPRVEPDGPPIVDGVPTAPAPHHDRPSIERRANWNAELAAKTAGDVVTWLPPVDAGFAKILVGTKRRGPNLMGIMRVVGTNGENLRGDHHALMGAGVLSLTIRRLQIALAELESAGCGGRTRPSKAAE